MSLGEDMSRRALPCAVGASGQADGLPTHPRAAGVAAASKRFCLAALLSLAGVVPAAACDGIDDHLELLACLETEYERADAELNAAWPVVLANPPSGSDQQEQRQRIRASQRAWIAFRDADCAAKADVGIPKYWRMNELYCLISHTRHRTQDLLTTYGE